MSRTLFGTDGIRGVANIYPMTPEIALKVGKALMQVMGKNVHKPKIIIGKDTRLSGYMLEFAMTAGISSMGGRTFLVGPLPTPAIAHLTKSMGAVAGVVLSASHNPAEDNGIKIFDGSGYKLQDKVEGQIESLVLSKEIAAAHIKGNMIGKTFRIDDASGRYIEYAKSTIGNANLAGLKIVLDCANGAAYNVAPYIFQELGAEVIVLNNTPNGLNINYNCGAVHPEVIAKQVVQENADIGIAFDGDADRVIMVDEQGTLVDGDHVLAICALDMLSAKKLAKNTLVATVYSNLALDVLMQKQGIKVIRAENGDRYVIEEMRKGGYNLGGEFSGHLIFGDYSTTGDGIISSLQILKIMNEKKKKLSALESVLHKYPQVIISVKVRQKTPLASLKAVQQAIKDGEKAIGADGRVYVRYSGTQDVARVMVEGKEQKKIQAIAQHIAEQFRKV